MMPAPVCIFAEIAAAYGDVDPNDIDAVQKWYIESLPELKPAQIDDILDRILRHEGDEPSLSRGKSYPVEMPLPSLKDAPPVSLPLIPNLTDLLIRRIWRRLGLKKK